MQSMALSLGLVPNYRKQDAAKMEKLVIFLWNSPGSGHAVFWFFMGIIWMQRKKRGIWRNDAKSFYKPLRDGDLNVLYRFGAN